MTQDEEQGHGTRKMFSPGGEASARGTVEKTRVKVKPSTQRLSPVSLIQDFANTEGRNRQTG